MKMMESSLWQGRPAARRYFLNSRTFAFLAVLAGSVAASVALNRVITAPQARRLFFEVTAGWAGLLMMAAACFYAIYRSQGFAVRPHGVELTRGVLVRDHKTVLWNQLRSLELERSIVDRLLGTGTIRFYTSDVVRSDGPTPPRYDRLSAVSDAESVYRLIQETMSRAGAPR